MGFLPEFDAEGNLPRGVFRATLDEAVARFDDGSPARSLVTERLRRIYHSARSTGHLVRFVIFGSYITAEPAPNDVDVVLLMRDEFDVSVVTGEARIVFLHQDAEAHFGASIFWTTISGALGGEQAMIEYWQVRRDGGYRGIVEIIEETT